MYPTLLDFPVPIPTYGALLALAFAGGIVLGLYHGPFLGISRNQILDLAVWVMLSAVFGARVLYILIYPQQFQTIFSMLALNKGGLIFFGGFISTVVAVILYGRIHGISLRDLGDLVAPSLILGHMIGRVGCFMNGCCYGIPTKSQFGMVFPNLNDNLVRHPTQVYEAAFLLILLFLAFAVFHLRVRKNYFFPGLLWGSYVFSYSIFRFLNETLRGDNRGGTFTSLQLSISQGISLLGLLGAIIWLVISFWIYRKQKSEIVNERKD